MVDYEEILRRTLDDGRLSRAEREALGQLLDEARPHEFALLRNRCFALAAERLEGGEAQRILDWCEDVVQLVASREVRAGSGAPAATAAAVFSPGDACWRRIVRAVTEARAIVDVCVYTLTDDRIAEALTAAHARGTRVRLLTDDDKAGDLGSDATRLASRGIEVRMDRTTKHMHHKFALFDDRLLITGSYNWTRQAADYNEENLVVLGDPALLRAFRERFDALWARFA